MSQFNFPRINFHGTVYLDTPTANNGKFTPLVFYDQAEAQPYLPPRVYLTPAQITAVQNQFPSFTIIDNSYVEITPINTGDLFNQWAVMPLGTSPADPDYWGLYNMIPCTDGTPGNLAGNIPGYWNYYGDLSVYAKDITITGVQIPNLSGGVSTFTPQYQNGCPEILADMLGASFSFHQDFFNPKSKTTAVFCDVDSEGQTCTQIFYGKAGVYNKYHGVPRTFFTGKPCKSTANWLNIFKVINWSDMSLTPMGGAASFYSTIPLDIIDPQLQAVLNQYAGEQVNALFMKILIHEVHEVRNPNYQLMPTKPMGSNQTNIPKNPAIVSFTGSLCPAVSGDMRTNSICRILKNPSTTNIPIQPSDTNNYMAPMPKGSTQRLQLPPSVQLAPAFLKYDPAYNLISLDLINTLPEYGVVEGNLANYAGKGDVPPFNSFETYDFGAIDLYFLPDSSSNPVKVGSFNHGDDYNMQQYLAKGGMVDLVATEVNSFNNGSFYLNIGTTTVMTEDDYYIITDQQGSYAEQNQTSTLYMVDGLPKDPIILRAFYRGQPIPASQPLAITMQAFSLATGAVNNSSYSIYDGIPFNYPVANDGCLCYGFSPASSALLAQNLSNIFYYLSNGYFITTRVLSIESQLIPYLNGSMPVTWDVVYQNIFKNYHVVLPIMNVIIPFKAPNWNDPSTQKLMLLLTDESSWEGFMYMPVTRELSATQRSLLQRWANQTSA